MYLPRSMQKLKLTSKLLTAFLAVGLIPFAIITSVALNQASKSLSKQAFGQLLSLRDVKKSQVESYLQTMKDQILTLSEDRMIVDAMYQFTRDFASFTRENDLDAPKIGELRNKLATYYNGDFSTEYQRRNENRSPNVSQIVNQIDDISVALQYHYIKANPNPLGSKENLDRAQDDSLYSRSHAYFHPILRDYLKKFGYYDIFLVTPDTGRIVYTVFKELDFSTSLIDGPYAQTDIGEAFRSANAITTTDVVAVTDYKQYFPSYEDPAGFIASPIFNDGQKIGVLIFQFPIDRLNTIMKARAGLGETGETYLVGKDLLMRSDSFLDPKNHSVVNSFKNPKKGQVDTEASRSALSGKTAEKILIDYNGNPVLSAYAPLWFEGLHWALIAEIDEAEAFAAITTLKWIVGVVTVICVIIIAGLALLITRGIVRPVQSVAQAMHTIATERDLTVQVPVDTQDEIGTMANEFNSMMKALRQSFVLFEVASESVSTQASDVSQRATSNKDRAEDEEKQMTTVQSTVLQMGETAGEVQGSSNRQAEAATSSFKSVEHLIESMREVNTASNEQIQEANAATERVAEMGETASKVTATAQNQSEQVEQVTDSLRQIAESVEEMTKAANRATEQGRTVLSAAEEGRHTVDATVAGMQAIKDSSDQISDIINVITDIAEQTNLLALNAAIEAARAGVHGKGFAVVADEVGKLAQRSSEAAKEVTQLIKDSTARVDEGTRLTDRSQEALRKIAQGGEINMQAIEEIGTTTNMLANNTSQVNQFITDLNKLAQDIVTMASQQGQRREEVQKALSALVEKANTISSKVNLATEQANLVGDEMKGVLERSDNMKKMTAIQAERSQSLIEITTESATRAKQTVSGAGEVVSITLEMQRLAANLTRQVGQFKIKDAE
jgi:methyl-accepting chemotaxis protein